MWLFLEHLTLAGAFDDLFAAFDGWLKGKGYLAVSGQIIDASIISAPRRRNTDVERADLKEGQIPEARAAKPKKRNTCKYRFDGGFWRGGVGVRGRCRSDAASISGPSRIPSILMLRPSSSGSR